MGQQQLLLIVLGVIIVGTAIIIGIALFHQASVEHKRDIVVNECQHLATLAIEYSKKPIIIGGGGNTFTGWTVPSQLQSTVNGNYAADIEGDKLIITGTGSEVVSGSDFIKVKTTIIGDSITTVVLN